MLQDNDNNMRTGTRERLKAKIAKSRNEKVLICLKCIPRRTDTPKITTELVLTDAAKLAGIAAAFVFHHG